jgi:hypothetical protein
MRRTDFWATRPSDIPAGAVGYFGATSSMRRGQRVKVIAEARRGFFQVAPVDRKSKICGQMRSVKRSNLSPLQPDFFILLS